MSNISTSLSPVRALLLLSTSPSWESSEALFFPFPGTKLSGAWSESLSAGKSLYLRGTTFREGMLLGRRDILWSTS